MPISALSRLYLWAASLRSRGGRLYQRHKTLAVLRRSGISGISGISGYLLKRDECLLLLLSALSERSVDGDRDGTQQAAARRSAPRSRAQLAQAARLDGCEERRVEAVAPSMHKLTNQHLALALGSQDKNSFDAAKWAELRSAIAPEIGRNTQTWKRVVAWINPFSWLLSK